MAHKHPSTDRGGRLSRALDCLGIYGAERARWPEEARILFDAFSGEEEFEAARGEAALLDEALALSPAPQAGDALKERLLAAFAPPAARKSLFAGFWFRPGRRGGRLIQGGALAGLTAIGFAIGAATANEGAGIENDPAFRAQTTFAFASEEGDALWAQEE